MFIGLFVGKSLLFEAHIGWDANKVRFFQGLLISNRLNVKVLLAVLSHIKTPKM